MKETKERDYMRYLQLEIVSLIVSIIISEHLSKYTSYKVNRGPGSGICGCVSYLASDSDDQALVL